MADWIGIVLAGGKSRRMGRDKAELRWTHDQTFLDRAVGVLREAGCEKVIVSGQRAGYDHVPDRWPDHGPLGGIASVLAARPELEGAVLIMPVDMPETEPATLVRLLKAAEDRNGAAYAGYPLPMVLDVNKTTRAAIEQSITGKRLALHTLLARLDFAGVAPLPSDCLDNINRPKDYREPQD